MALLAEAKPLIKDLKLTLQQQTPFAIYANEDVMLIISGMGPDQALMATTHLLTKYPASPRDIIVNFGIAGAIKDYKIGEIITAHTIKNRQNRKFYPDMRLSHPFKEVVLTSLDSVQTQESADIQAVDMEAYGVCQAALNFVKSSQIAVFKVISDHFSAAIPTKEQVYDWIQPHIEILMALLDNAQTKLPDKLSYSDTLQAKIEKNIMTLKLTQTQANQLHDRIKGYILRHGKEPMMPKPLPEMTQHKKEQKDAFNKLINILSS